MADRGVSLKSNQWSCSELTRGAEVCADMAGLTLTLDPQNLSKEQLLQAIQDLATKILHSKNCNGFCSSSIDMFH